MEVQVLGIGDAFTSQHHNTSFLVRSQRCYLIDGPQGLFRILRRRGIDPSEIDHVIVTHVHGDHTSGLETLILWKKHVQGSKVTLCTSDAVYRELRERFFPRFSQSFSADLHQVAATRFEDHVDFLELKGSEPTRLDDELTVETRENWHPPTTLGLKLNSPRGTVGISGDTCYRPALLMELLKEGVLDEARYEKLAGDWLWSADVIYHEVTRYEGTAHTHERDLLALPAGIRKKIRLIHLPDDFSEGKLPLAREGEIVSFPRAGTPVITTKGK